MAEDLLIKNLQNKSLFDYEIQNFNVIETHISWILLTGTYAYKIKKPLNLGFVDYESLTKRKTFCEEELRLNKLLAKDLYCQVIAIYGSFDAPSFKKNGEIIEYAIQMKQFNQSYLFSKLLMNHALTPLMCQETAKEIAYFHIAAPIALKDSPYAKPNSIKQNITDNFNDCLALLSFKDQAVNNDETTKLEISESMTTLKNLKSWSLQNFQNNITLLEKRKEKGFIRECHGDLHLNNIVIFEEKVTPFDRIEFNLDFLWIDICNDIAFLLMDLESNNASTLYFTFLNQYLEITGDYEGLALLAFYKVYRAMIRAKVALATRQKNSFSLFKFYLDYISKLRQTLDEKKFSCLMITVGVSGSGKTKLCQALAPSLECIHLRSDIERRRLFINDRYTPERTTKTYQHLYETAENLLKLNFNVMVDATFLKENQRQKFRTLAAKLQVPFIILCCQASKEILIKRIQERRFDASEATIGVLEEQLQNEEKLSHEEKEFCLKISSDNSLFLEESLQIIYDMAAKQDAHYKT